MTLSESDEALPLLDRDRRDQEDFNADYDSLRSNRSPAASGISHCSGDLNRLQRSDEGITYTWTDLSVYGFPRKDKLSCWGRLFGERERVREQSRQILKEAYGIAHPGELLAIMGASGAGKTSLLNALTYSLPDSVVRGSRRVNGFSVDRATVARLSAYVEQDNLFLGTLSVKEHLVFQALVRMDRGVSYRQKLRRVEDVMAELGLEKCQNTMIGFEGRTKGISGGERKRLSFASEILTNPPIMFCDEPTSGLDSFMALNVINVLKSMAIRGKTVICTIHQPSSEIFSSFDKILLLAEGRTAFLGKPVEAISFFAELGASPPANYNPADFFIELLAVVPHGEDACRRTIELVCGHFEQSPQGLEVATEIESVRRNQVPNDALWKTRTAPWTLPPHRYPATWLSQFGALFWRSWLNIIKEPLLVKVRLFQTVVLSFMVGLIYHGQKLDENGVMNINGVLFTFLTNMTFQNVFAVISVFCNELPVFMKEQSNKLYRVDAYFLSKTLAEAPMFLLIPVVFTAITYYWIGLKPEPHHFFFTVLILVLVTNVATSFGYFISCVSTHPVMALSIGPPVVIPFLLFGGFLLNAGSIPVYFKGLSYLSWFKYGNEALLINQWSDVKYIECNASDVVCPRSGEIVLEMYRFEEKNFCWDIGSLLVLIFLFRSLAFLALALKTVRAQRCK